ncbi:MAG TPA: PDZ domain-containing protein [Flavitalea sp.]|nr:PDZ domain-containing protein [Flavitalea sp.]
MKTIEAAIQRVAGIQQTNVNIFLRAGRYAPNKPVQISSTLLRSHKLEISSYKDELVTVTGSKEIKPKWNAYNKNIVQTGVGRNLSIDQLYCNGLPLPLARYPNYDSAARIFNGTSADAIGSERISNWKNPRGGFVHALHRAEWGDFHYRITGKNADTLSLEGGWQNNRLAPMHKNYRFVENIFEELDAPGEWFYNRGTGILYLYPPTGMNIDSASFERSVLKNIVELKGSETAPVENIIIKGILFTGTSRTFMLTREPLLRSDWKFYRGGAIYIEGGRDILITRCKFEQLGGNAIVVSKYNRRINIEHNYIHHIGASAISFVGDPAAVRSPVFEYADAVPFEKMDTVSGPKTQNYPSECLAFDNLIHNIGTIEKQVAGIQISMSMDIAVRHNTIYNVPRSGINIGDGCWGGHNIEYNDVFNTVLETGDHGAFNSWGRDRYWLPDINSVNVLVERYPKLPLMDVIKPVTINNNRFKCEHGWDIDLDDGSTNYRIYNNVCLSGGLKLREGYYRVVKNNVIINNTFHPHVWYSKSFDIFSQNIVTGEYAPIRVDFTGKMVDSNFFIQNNALRLVQQKNTDAHSLQGDPEFEDPDSGDFRVKPSSKALTIGFVNFPMNQFGVISPVLKQIADKPSILGVRTLTETKKHSTEQWLGATIKNVETLGEQSASGLPDMHGVLILSVASGSLAENNQLKIGDVIRSVNSKPVINISELLNAIQMVTWQGEVKAGVFRNQQLKDFTIRLK